MRARAVPICWPISALMIETVTMPPRSMRYQIVGSNSVAGEVEAASAAVKPGRGNPNRTLVPAAPVRKLRRDTGFCFATGPASTLSMRASHFGRSELDRPADTDISHASAQAAAHNGVDVLVGLERTGGWQIEIARLGGAERGQLDAELVEVEGRDLLVAHARRE